MNTPSFISDDDFAKAWAKAICALKCDAWNAWNYIVTINRPNILNQAAVEKLKQFAEQKGLISPDKVRHTIFPQRIYDKYCHGNREKLYRSYNNYYKFTRKMAHSGWGTYFKRMISYKTQNGMEYDQLGSIIDHINDRKNNYGAGHVMLIPQVGADSNKKMGAPCLNYVAVQVERNGQTKCISLLAVYRNHDYRERTFGNYWGLCNLLKYICSETDSDVGSITCVSSHAYVGNNKNELLKIANEILGDTNE